MLLVVLAVIAGWLVAAVLLALALGRAVRIADRHRRDALAHEDALARHAGRVRRADDRPREGAHPGAAGRSERTVRAAS